MLDGKKMHTPVFPHMVVVVVVDGSLFCDTCRVEHLRGKASNIHTAYLNFQGRNLVLYATGYDDVNGHDGERSLGTADQPYQQAPAAAVVAGDLRPKKRNLQQLKEAQDS